uniref:ATP-binding protein n=1 Tax=candidate division CPR3 bacterium TaxID=2268181 RepID=A0A7V3N5P9_UNCC3
MSLSFLTEKYKLSRNPFPPAASGIEAEKIYIPQRWQRRFEKYYRLLSTGSGAKGFPIVGEYGSGKTALLKGYLKGFFEEKRIKTIYFKNPGVQFYDLANDLMGSLGRNEFSKALWERCKEFLRSDELYLFPRSFSDFLNDLKKRSKEEEKRKVEDLSNVVIKNLKLTSDPEIAYRIASMIAETATKPYFSYRDFVAGAKGAVVAEKKEPEYFQAIIRGIIEAYDVEGVAFLIDEFEEIAFPKRMTRKQTYDYLATLRSLIDLSQAENLWIVIAMTPEAAEETRRMNPGLWQRFVHRDHLMRRDRETEFKLEPLDIEESKHLIIWWLDRAREENKNKLFPFPKDIDKILENRPDIRLPRPLVKLCFFALAKAENEQIEAPIPIDFIEKVVNEFYPRSKVGSENGRK